MNNGCWGCIYRSIFEDGHEWLTCRCQLTKQTCSPFRGCDQYKEEENTDDN